jgi:hypothetical protein
MLMEVYAQSLGEDWISGKSQEFRLEREGEALCDTSSVDRFNVKLL